MSESSEQISLFIWASYAVRKYPELNRLFHVPNGRKRDKKTAAILKKEGVKSGVPDLFLPVPKRGFHGLFIEMKDVGEKPTATQIDWLNYLGEAGYMAVYCQGWNAARETIENYLGDKK